MISSYFTKSIIGISTKSVQKNVTAVDKTQNNREEKKLDDSDFENLERTDYSQRLSTDKEDVSMVDEIEKTGDGSARTEGAIKSDEGKIVPTYHKYDVCNDGPTVADVLINHDYHITNCGDEEEILEMSDGGDHQNTSRALFLSSPQHLKFDGVECSGSTPGTILTAAAITEVDSLDNFCPLPSTYEENIAQKNDICHNQFDFGINDPKAATSSESTAFRKDDMCEINEESQFNLQEMTNMSYHLLVNTSCNISITDEDVLQSKEDVNAQFIPSSASNLAFKLDFQESIAELNESAGNRRTITSVEPSGTSVKIEEYAGSLSSEIRIFSPTIGSVENNTISESDLIAENRRSHSIGSGCDGLNEETEEIKKAVERSSDSKGNAISKNITINYERITAVEFVEKLFEMLQGKVLPPCSISIGTVSLKANQEPYEEDCVIGIGIGIDVCANTLLIADVLTPSITNSNISDLKDLKSELESELEFVDLVSTNFGNTNSLDTDLANTDLVFTNSADLVEFNLVNTDSVEIYSANTDYTLSNEETIESSDEGKIKSDEASATLSPSSVTDAHSIVYHEDASLKGEHSLIEELLQREHSFEENSLKGSHVEVTEHSLLEEHSTQVEVLGDERLSTGKESSSLLIGHVITVETEVVTVEVNSGIKSDIHPRSAIESREIGIEDVTESGENPYKWLQCEASLEYVNAESSSTEIDLCIQSLSGENHGNYFTLLKHRNISISSLNDNGEVVYSTDGTVNDNENGNKNGNEKENVKGSGKMLSSGEIELQGKNNIDFHDNYEDCPVSNYDCNVEGDCVVDVDVDVDFGCVIIPDSVCHGNGNDDEDDVNINNNNNDNDNNNNNDDIDRDDFDINVKNNINHHNNKTNINRIDVIGEIGDMPLTDSNPRSDHSPVHSNLQDKCNETVPKNEIRICTSSDPGFERNLTVKENAIYQEIIAGEIGSTSNFQLSNVDLNESSSKEYVEKQFHDSSIANIFYDADVSMIGFDKIVFNCEDDITLNDEDIQNYFKKNIQSDNSKSNSSRNKSKCSFNDDDSENNYDNNNDYFENSLVLTNCDVKNNSDNNHNDGNINFNVETASDDNLSIYIDDDDYNSNSDNYNSHNNKKPIHADNNSDDNDTNINIHEDDFINNNDHRSDNNDDCDKNLHNIDISTKFDDNDTTSIESASTKDDNASVSPKFTVLNDKNGNFSDSVSVSKFFSTDENLNLRALDNIENMKVRSNRKIHINMHENNDFHASSINRNNLSRQNLDTKNLIVENQSNFPTFLSPIALVRILQSQSGPLNLSVTESPFTSLNYRRKIPLNSNLNMKISTKNEVNDLKSIKMKNEKKKNINFLSKTFTATQNEKNLRNSPLLLSQTQSSTFKNSDLNSLNSLESEKKYFPSFSKYENSENAYDILPIYDQLLPKSVISKSYQSTILSVKLDTEQDNDEMKLIELNDLKLLESTVNHVGMFVPRYSMYSTASDNSEFIKNIPEKSEFLRFDDILTDTNVIYDLNNNKYNNVNQNNNIDKNETDTNNYRKIHSNSRRNQRNTVIDLSKRKFSNNGNDDKIDENMKCLDDESMTSSNNITNNNNNIIASNDDIDNNNHCIDDNSNYLDNSITSDDQSTSYDMHSLSEYSVLSTTRTNKNRKNIKSIGEMKLKLINLKEENFNKNNLEKNVFMANWNSKFELFLNSKYYSNILNLMKAIDNLRRLCTALDSKVRSPDLLVDQTKFLSKITNLNRIDIVDLKTRNEKPTDKINSFISKERNFILTQNSLKRSVTPTLQEIEKNFNTFSMLEYFFILVDNNGSLKNSIRKLKFKEYRTEVHQICEKEFKNIKKFLFMIIGAQELFEKHFE